MFLYGWSLLHIIDEASPLAGETFESLKAAKAFVLLTIGGIDETTGQMLMSRVRSTSPPPLRWNHAFVDVRHVG